MKKVIKHITVLALVLVLANACKSKDKQADAEQTPDTAGAQQDTNIQNQPMDFSAQGSDSGQISGLYTINFDYDKSTLNEDARGKAQKNAEWLKANPGKGLEIEGHCDRNGSIEYNLALGERRARAVKQYMLNLGVEAKRLSVVTYGKEKLLDMSETESADAKNRRANFIVK